MVRCKSVVVVAIVCLSIAGAMRMKQHQVSAVRSTDERSRMAPSVSSAATVETGRRRIGAPNDRTFDQKKKQLDKKCLQKKGKRREKQIEKLMTMSEEELRERCRGANLPDVGTKPALVESLRAWAYENNKRKTSDMSEEELRERCRLDNLPDVGTKAELVESLRSLAYEKKMKRKGVSEQSSKESSLHDAQLAEEDVEEDLTEEDVELKVAAGAPEPRRKRRVFREERPEPATAPADAAPAASSSSMMPPPSLPSRRAPPPVPSWGAPPPVPTFSQAGGSSSRGGGGGSGKASGVPQVEEDLTEEDIIEKEGVEEDVEEEDIIADILVEDAEIAEARDDAQVREIQRAIEAVSGKFGMLTYLT